MLKKTITPKNLKMLRAKFGNTQIDLAKILNLSKAQYSKKEKGLATFTLFEAKIISDFYNLTIEDVFYRDLVYSKEPSSLNYYNSKVPNLQHS